MKKKGLIISTIVMVVVLIAALTTSTYAWFNASAKTSVDDITLTIDANSAVSIGAHPGNGNTQNDYMYNKVTLGNGGAAASANNPTYTGGQKGLGTKLGFSTTTALNLSTGVGCATSITPKLGTETITPGSITTDAAAFDPSKVVYKANSVDGDDSEVDLKTLDYAVANTDFIVLKMGAQAAQPGVKGIYATVTVTTTDTDTTLKMNAALHFYIRVAHRLAADEVESWNTAHSTSLTAGALNGEYDYIEFDLFGSATDETAKEALGDSITVGGDSAVALSYDSTNNQAVATFSFLIAGVNSASGSDLARDGSYITPFDIYAYVWGADEDCVSTATGCGVKINIEFTGVKVAGDVATSLLTWAA